MLKPADQPAALSLVHLYLLNFEDTLPVIFDLILFEPLIVQFSGSEEIKSVAIFFWIDIRFSK